MKILTKAFLITYLFISGMCFVQGSCLLGVLWIGVAVLGAVMFRIAERSL
jgi:hypothetical protein